MNQEPSPREGASASAARILLDVRVRLSLLVTVLAVLLLYLLAGQVSGLGLMGTSGSGPTCGPAQGPPLADVSPAQLIGLREAARSAMAGRYGRLYARGTVTTANAWTDDAPIAPTPGSASLPGGYELRWWARNLDDVGAAVYAFPSAAAAHAFFLHATSTRCRRQAQAAVASWPPGAVELSWRNPDRAMQEDVYLLRGARVYEVSDVRSEQTPLGSAGERRAGFAVAESLACSLPQAGCGGLLGAPLVRRDIVAQLAIIELSWRAWGWRASSGAGPGSAPCEAAGRAGAGTGAVTGASPLLYEREGVGLRLVSTSFPTSTAAGRALGELAGTRVTACEARVLLHGLERAGGHADVSAVATWRLTGLTAAALATRVRLRLHGRRGGVRTIDLDVTATHVGRLIDVLVTYSGASAPAFQSELAGVMAGTAASEQRP